MKSFKLLLVFLLLVLAGTVFGDGKTNLKPTFKYEGQVYVIDRIEAHISGAKSVEFTPSENGGWYLFIPQPETGRQIHRQVK